ncbi:MAG: helix-hairpin-helix domain-containing protein, partial [bacterium]
MDKAQIAEILEEIGFLLELKGENPFKTRAYENGARIVKGLTKDIRLIVETGEIREIKGIGSALADKITALVQTGRLEYYEKLTKEFPAGLLEMAKVPGIGPRKIRKLYDEENIKSIADLERACKENRIAGIEGFGIKTQAKILEGIAFIKKHSSRHLYHRAHTVASELLETIKNYTDVIRAEVTGSLRRCKETVKDIDIVVSAEAKDRAAIMDYFTSYPGLQTVNAKGETKSSIITAQGMQADLRIVSDDEFPYILHHFTGSKEHNTAMRGFAKKLGLKMSEYGLFKEDGERIDCRNETEIFNVFGMDYVPPELREDLGEIEAARDHTLPNLIDKTSIKGILHTHTTYSDGANTLREMAEACRNMGMQYLGISDHSK